MRQAPAAAQVMDDVQSRNQDLKRIHAIAERKGLIRHLIGTTYDRAAYRAFLQEHYNTQSAAGFDSTQRASLINALERLPYAVEDEFSNVA
jgi:hypothetical protein